MVIFKDNRRFELHVDAVDDAWQASLREFVPGRLMPTLHLLRTFDARRDAIEALRRRWRVLFPEDPPLDWREPPAVSLRRQSQPHRRRRPSESRESREPSPEAT